MSGSITVILASLMLVSLVAVFAVLSFERVYVRPEALASLVAEELREIYGYRVLSLGVNCLVRVNATHVTVRLLGVAASCRLNVDRDVVPSEASGSLIVLYGNSTHVWVSSQIEYSPVRVKSSVYEVVFTDIGFENATVSLNEAEVKVTIEGTTTEVEVMEQVPTTSSEPQYWRGVRVATWNDLYRWSVRYSASYIWVEDSAWWRVYGYYYGMYIRNSDGSYRVFSGTVKIGFKIRGDMWYARVFLLNPDKVRELERYGYGSSGVYKYVSFGWGIIGSRWRTFNVTLSYSKPYVVAIGGWKWTNLWDRTIKVYIKDGYLYRTETRTVPGEFEGDVVGVKNAGNRVAKIRVRLVEGGGLLGLKIWLNGTLQIDLENGLTEGSWVTLKPGETLIVKFYGRDDDNDYEYRLVVDCADAALNVVKQLSLKIEDA